jgi:hypothetical protein
VADLVVVVLWNEEGAVIVLQGSPGAVECGKGNSQFETINALTARIVALEAK